MSEETTSEEMSLDNLDYVKSGGPSDDELAKLDGTRAKVSSVTIVDDETRWKDNVMLPGEETVAVKKLQIETEEFGQELIGRPIKHVQKYTLKERPDGSWYVSLHEKSNTAKFLSKYKIDNFKNAVGVEVVLVVKTNPATNSSRLHISI